MRLKTAVWHHLEAVALHLFALFVSESRSHSVAHAVLDLVILLPQLMEC